MIKVKRTLLDAAEFKLDRSSVLGKGRSSIVFRGTLSGNPVAVKRILSLDANAQLDRDGVRIISALTKLNHPNVLKLLDADEDDDFRYFALELCLGNLLDYTNGTYKGGMPSEVTALHQMASGLEYIHSQGFIHGNLRPENVLIFNAEQLKISDFGLTKTISISASFSMSSSGSGGSPTCQSTELINGDDVDDEGNVIGSIPADIFALGCVLFGFLTMGGHPFIINGGSRHLVVSNILEGKFSLEPLKKKSHFAAVAIEEMIRKEPSERLGLKELIKLLNEQSVK